MKIEDCPFQFSTPNQFAIEMAQKLFDISIRSEIRRLNDWCDSTSSELSLNQLKNSLTFMKDCMAFLFERITLFTLSKYNLAKSFSPSNFSFKIFGL